MYKTNKKCIHIAAILSFPDFHPREKRLHTMKIQLIFCSAFFQMPGKIVSNL
jgi:hypothetical protein